MISPMLLVWWYDNIIIYGTNQPWHIDTVNQL
jgi:hypothetical protein